MTCSVEVYSVLGQNHPVGPLEMAGGCLGNFPLVDCLHLVESRIGPQMLHWPECFPAHSDCMVGSWEGLYSKPVVSSVDWVPPFVHQDAAELKLEPLGLLGAMGLLGVKRSSDETSGQVPVREVDMIVERMVCCSGQFEAVDR